MSTCASHAAELPKICYFTLLPSELLDKIALLLEWNDRETDEAFIKRAKQYGTLLPEHMTQARKHRVYNIDDPNDAWMFVTYSTDRTKVIMFEHAWIHQGWDPAKTVDEASVINLTTNTKYTHKKLADIIKDNQKSAWNTGTNKRSYHIAVSRTGNHLAELQHWQQIPFELDTTKTVLAVTEIKTGIKREYPFPSFYFCQDFQSISFNKQGTKVVAIGDGSLGKYVITKLVPTKEHEAKSIMTFDLFLKTHGICKSLRVKERNDEQKI